MKKRFWGILLVVAVWLGLSIFAWVKPQTEYSLAERRKLDRFPASAERFSEDFESYSQDQFPLRDSFRSLKAILQYYVFGQKDNNGIYLAEHYAAKIVAPLSLPDVNNAARKFSALYETYLQGSRVFLSIVPDKGYFLAERHGYPALDYALMTETLRAGMPFATYCDLFSTLSLSDYYRTDTHWRQEQLLPTAEKLASALGATVGVYEKKAAEKPFYGVYSGQSALPLPAETLYYLENDTLRACTVYNYETGATTGIYTPDLADVDGYQLFLSGAAPLLTISNPNAEGERGLIVFRDSFGSSLVPLLVESYRTVTLVDIRYVASSYLGRFLEFDGQDVLFLYSTLVLNENLATFK